MSENTFIMGDDSRNINLEHQSQLGVQVPEAEERVPSGGGCTNVGGK